MPILAMFYGIIIRMYYADNKQHHVPLIHAEYGSEQAVSDIADGKLLAGKFPKNKTRLVQAWIEIRREELNADFSTVHASRLPKAEKGKWAESRGSVSKHT